MDMKKLIEKMDQFAGQAVGQKPGDQVRGTEKATPKKSGKHPFAGRLVGASESKSLLADLEKELVEGAVKRGLKEEFESFKSQGVAEGSEPGHREIERWATKSEDNQILYDAYIRAGNMAAKAWEQNDGAAYTRLQLRKKQIRDVIAKKMSEQGVAEGAPELLKAEIPLVRQIEKEMAAHGYEKGTEEYKKVFDHMLSFHRKFGNADRINQKDIEEGMTPDNMFLDKASRVKQGDKVIYKGKVVGIATGEVMDGNIAFKPTDDEYPRNKHGIAILPVDNVYLREDENPRIDLTPNYPNYSKLIGEFVGIKGQRAQFKIIAAELKPGQGETEKIVNAVASGKPILVDISRVKNRAVMERIVKHGDEYRLLSHKGKNLGDFSSHAAAEKHEHEVQYFKHAHEDTEVDEAGEYIPPPGEATAGDTHSPSPIGSIEMDEEEEFGYKKLHPEIFKARQKYPAAKSDMEALIMAVRDEEHDDVNRLTKVNDREDAEIDALDHEEDYLQSQIKALKSQLNKLEMVASARKPMEEDVPPAVATAGGPAGATQPSTQPNQPVDPAQMALQKQQQQKLQQNLAGLKTAGVQIDPAKAAQSFQKADAGAPMNSMDKDTISKMAPAIGNVMSNPSTATQLNTLIKKAGGGA